MDTTEHITNDLSLLYWRGMVDAEIAGMDHRIGAIEMAALRVNMENSAKLDHLHTCIERISTENINRIERIATENITRFEYLRECLEKRGAALNKMIGALAALIFFVQIVAPFILRLLK